MKRTYLLFVLLAFQYPFVIMSQCDTGSELECMCNTAPLLCSVNEFDGYSFSMSSYEHPFDGPDPLCNGPYVPNNPHWFAFLAWCTEIEITVEISNCVVINPPFGSPTFGIQVGVYENCNEYAEVICIADDCNNENDKILDATGLVMGETYYLMVDGCFGSACDITFAVAGSCSEEIESFMNPISGATNVCIGDTETYLVDDLAQATTYHWFIDGTETSTTNMPEESITWNTAGEYELCVDASNACVEVSDDPNPVCTVISNFALNECDLHYYFIASFGFWDEPSNWSNNLVPDMDSDVIILAGNTCNIRTGTIAECNVIDVEYSAVLNCLGSARICVFAD